MQIPILVANYYENYSYWVPVMVVADVNEATDLAVAKNAQLREHIEADIHDKLKDNMAYTVPEFLEGRDDLPFKEWVEMTETQKRQERKRLSDIHRNNYLIEALAHAINRYQDLLKPENLEEYIEDCMNEEFYSVKMIEYRD